MSCDIHCANEIPIWYKHPVSDQFAPYEVGIELRIVRDKKSLFTWTQTMFDIAYYELALYKTPISHESPSLQAHLKEQAEQTYVEVALLQEILLDTI